MSINGVIIFVSFLAELSIRFPMIWSILYFQVWDIRTKTQIFALSGHENSVCSVFTRPTVRRSAPLFILFSLAIDSTSDPLLILSQEY